MLFVLVLYVGDERHECFFLPLSAAILDYLKAHMEL